MQKYLLLVTVQVVLVSSATWYKKLPASQPNHGPQPGCYVKEIGRVIPFGQEVTTSGCIRVECSPRYLYYSSCGVEDGDPACVSYPGHKNANYPDCCPSSSCDGLINNRI